MEYKVIGNKTFELLEKVIYDDINTHYIVRQHKESFSYPGIGSDVFNISDLQSDMKLTENNKYLSTEDRESRIVFFNLVIGILRKYNRNIIIDELLSGRETENIEGLSPLVLAC